MSFGSNSSGCYSRVPPPSKVFKLLPNRDTENEALEYYENRNHELRTQYDNLDIAPQAIGAEFSPMKKLPLMLDEDMENNVDQETTTPSPVNIDLLPGLVDEELDENLMQFLN